MFPTTVWNGYLWVNKKAYRIGEPERGDMIYTTRQILGLEEDIVSEPDPHYLLQYRGALFPASYGSKKPRYVRRIIGLPGETIKIIDRQVYINGEPYSHMTEVFTRSQIIPANARDFIEHEMDEYEDLLTQNAVLLDNMEEIIIPEGHYFIMGDWRDHSLDSRYFGPVAKEKILGKITHILFARMSSEIGWWEGFIED